MKKSLESYQAKRNFKKTKEPRGKVKKSVSEYLLFNIIWHERTILIYGLNGTVL